MKPERAILIVDHNKEKWKEPLKLLYSELDSYNIIVVVEANAGDAMKFFKKFKPSIVLIHASITGGGFSLADTFYQMSIKMRKTIKIIVYSGEEVKTHLKGIEFCLFDPNIFLKEIKKFYDSLLKKSPD